MGRHPLQNPHYIKPDIGSMSRSLVDRIPLVYYIPPPPDEPSSGPITIPPEALIYPPKGKPTPARPKKPRFRWLRPKKKPAKGANAGGGADDEKDAARAEGRLARTRVWEDNWEKSEYPYVRLEENRATCAICLLDFEEPRRVGKDAPEDASTKDDGPLVGEGPLDGVVEVAARLPASGGDGELHLEDAGEGVQPLRLLACGHVFHVRLRAARPMPAD
jgi:hypothetical protein